MGRLLCGEPVDGSKTASPSSAIVQFRSDPLLRNTLWKRRFESVEGDKMLAEIKQPLHVA